MLADFEFSCTLVQDHTTSVVPVMMDWFDGTNRELRITFDGCDFHVSLPF